MKRSTVQHRIRERIKTLGAGEHDPWVTAGEILKICEDAGMNPPYMRTISHCMCSMWERCSCPPSETVYGWEDEDGKG
jgi:hypothetical protein